MTVLSENFRGHIGRGSANIPAEQCRITYVQPLNPDWKEQIKFHTAMMNKIAYTYEDNGNIKCRSCCISLGATLQDLEYMSEAQKKRWEEEGVPEGAEGASSCEAVFWCPMYKASKDKVEDQKETGISVTDTAATTEAPEASNALVPFDPKSENISHYDWTHWSCPDDTLWFSKTVTYNPNTIPN